MIKSLLLMVTFGLVSSEILAYGSLKESGFYQANEGRLSHKKLSLSNYIDKKWGRTSSKHYLFSMYSPQYPLWSDGAEKRRWVFIPKGGIINTDNPDSWIFPIGTKLWKEFSFLENNERKKIETRLLEKVGESDWLMESYVWNKEQTAAVLAPEQGVKNHYPIANGKFYDIPSKHDCEYCHSKAGINSGPQKTPVLGFSALQLSDDRDEGAIHGEKLTPYMMTLSKLQKLRKTSSVLQNMPGIPDSEKAPLQRSVFGYLHGNCGHCHNEYGLSEFTNTLNFNHDASASYIQQNGTYKTAIAKPITQYLHPSGSPLMVIDPGFAETSALIYRMTEEDEQYTFEVPQWHHSAGFSLTVGVKMPFVGTNVVDQKAVDIIKNYINDLETVN